MFNKWIEFYYLFEVSREKTEIFVLIVLCFVARFVCSDRAGRTTRQLPKNRKQFMRAKQELQNTIVSIAMTCRIHVKMYIQYTFCMFFLLPFCAIIYTICYNTRIIQSSSYFSSTLLTHGLFLKWKKKFAPNRLCASNFISSVAIYLLFCGWSMLSRVAMFCILIEKWVYGRQKCRLTST